MKDAAVGISTVTEPSGHSRKVHLSTENPSCFDLPRNGVDERPRDCRPIEPCTMIVDQDGRAIIRQNVALGHDFASRGYAPAHGPSLLRIREQPRALNLCSGDVKTTRSDLRSDPRLEAKRTQPLPHYNEGTLVDAMQNAWRFVEDPALRERLKECLPLSRQARRQCNPLTELESRNTETAINPPREGSLCIHACSLEHRLHAMPFRQFDGGGIGLGGIEEDRLTGNTGGQALK
jgi:hypothetical protein